MSVKWKDNWLCSMDAQALYESIRWVRRNLLAGMPDGTHVLVVDHASRDFVQIMGAAIDLDPTFLWRHYNERLNSDIYVPEMATLRNKFHSLVKVEKGRRSNTDAYQDPSTASTDDYRGIHMRGRVIVLPHSSQALSSRLSCYRVSSKSCEYRAIELAGLMFVLGLTYDSTGLILTNTIWPSNFDTLFSYQELYSYQELLRYDATHRQPPGTPMSMQPFLRFQTQHSRQSHTASLSSAIKESCDMFDKVIGMLSTPTSLSKNPELAGRFLSSETVTIS